MKEKYFHNTLDGKISCEVIESKIRKVDWHKEGDKLPKNEAILYLIHDELIFRDEKGNVIFNTKPYKIKWREKISDEISYFDRFKYRLKAFYLIATGKRLPFYFLGITNGGSFLEQVYGRDNYFDYLYFKNSIKHLESDIKMLDSKIKLNSTIEKAMIWFTLGTESTSNTEKFMDYYRCIERLASEYFGELENKLNDFVHKELIPVFGKNIGNRLRIPNSEKVKNFLEKKGVNHSLISQITTFRDQKVAHGQEIELEFNNNLEELNEKIKELSFKLIIRRLNEEFSGFRSNNLLVDYYVYENYLDNSKRIVEFDEINSFRKVKGNARFSTLNNWTLDEIRKILNTMNFSTQRKKNILHYHDISTSKEEWSKTRIVMRNKN